jgi:hypothetical protein
MLRRPLARKKVDGCARAAIRSNEVDDIRKEWIGDVVWEFFAVFKELVVRSFSEASGIGYNLIGA